MDAGIEKQSMAYFQHDTRFEQQCNPGLTTKVASPKSTIIVILLLLLLLCLLVSFLSLSAVVVLTARVEALETRLNDVELRNQDKESAADTVIDRTSTQSGKPTFVEEVQQTVSPTFEFCHFDCEKR